MHPRVARLTVLVVGLGIGAARVAVAATPVPHPTTNAVVVVSVTTLAPIGGRGGPTVSVRGDGDAAIQPALGRPGHPAPEPLVFRIDEAGLQRVLHGAEAAGLLRHSDYGRPRVVDHRRTVIDVDVGHGTRRVQIDGLADATGDDGLFAPQRSARTALRAFVSRVTDPSFFRGTLTHR